MGDMAIIPDVDEGIPFGPKTDVEKVRENVGRLINANVPESRINEYIDSEGVSRDMLTKSEEQRVGEALPETITTTEPDEVVKATQGWVGRPTFVGTGAVVGGIAGTWGGPPLIAVGATLGAGGASLLYDTVETLTRKGKGRRLSPHLKGLGPTRTALQEAQWEMFFAGLPMTASMVRTSFARAIGSMKPEARAMADKAMAMGLQLGPMHVAKRIKGVTKIMGIFPFVGGPLRKAQKAFVGSLSDYQADVLNTLAPTMDLYEFSAKLTLKAAKRFAAFNRIKASLYTKFDDAAAKLPDQDIVPTDGIADTVSKHISKSADEAIVLKPKGEGELDELLEFPVETPSAWLDDIMGKMLDDAGQPTEEFLGLPVKDALGAWFSKLQRLPDNISVAQARGLERELNALYKLADMGNMSGNSRQLLGKVKGALNDAKNNMVPGRNTPEDIAKVKAAWNAANDFFHKHKQIYEGVKGKKFEQVDKNIFKALSERFGTKESDEIFNNIFSTKSIEGMDDLEKLVGKNHFKQAVGKYLSESMKKAGTIAREGAVAEDLFSAQKLEQILGLNTQEGWSALSRMLKGTGVSPSQWKEFLEVAKAGTDIAIPDPSSFLMRRVTLAGARGLLGGILIGATAAAGGGISVTAAAIITLAARAGGKYLMNPGNLKKLTRIMTPDAPEYLKKVVLLSLLQQSIRGSAEENERTYKRKPGSISDLQRRYEEIK